MLHIQSIDGKSQIEVKKYQKSLTNLDNNFWKTLRNWLDDKFPQDEFKSLILCTTQVIGLRSIFKDWNSNKTYQRHQCLLKIYNEFHKKKKKNKQTQELLDYVMDSSRSDKLKLILGKVVIQGSYRFYEQLHKSIRDRYAKPIPNSSKDRFINNLLGFIISPSISNKNKWEISYDIFSEEVKELTRVLKEDSVVFPAKINLKDIDNSKYLNSPFVKKIEDINYEEVIPDAISDYIHTNSLTVKELKNRSNLENLKFYKEEINDDYKFDYRKAKRNADLNSINNCSKDFYDDFLNKSPETFTIYNSVPKYFRRGLIHNMANSVTDYKIKWNLKDE